MTAHVPKTLVAIAALLLLAETLASRIFGAASAGDVAIVMIVGKVAKTA